MIREPVGECKHKPGDWVAREKGMRHPEFGRVKSVMWDQFEGEWAINVTMYHPNGNRGKFEPCLPESHWFKIERPTFPLPHDLRGWVCWGESLRYHDAAPGVGNG